MTRDLLSLDFYGNEIIAVLLTQDDETDTLRVRHAWRKPCKAFAGAFVLDKEAAQRELTAVFDEMAEHTDGALSVIIGVRGNFLSFKRASGFESVSTRNRIIGTHEIEAALHNSIPTTLSDTLDVIDVLPQSFTIDGNTGIVNPRGLVGFTLEVETFLTLALSTHLQNLTNVFQACECSEFQILPSVIAQGDQLLSAPEKESGALLLDIGQSRTSAVMYHKGALVEAWELPFGQNRLAQAVADLLQNDVETALDVLKTYEPGTDEIIDDVLDEANLKLLQALKKELLQSLIYLQHPSAQLVLCGAAAGKKLLKVCKKVFGARKVRLSAADELLTDAGEANSPIYSGALAVATHALSREVQDLGITQEKPAGLLDGLLDKLGLNELF